MKLLHIDSGILGDQSVSRIVSAAAVARLRDLHPGIEVVTRDVAADPLPHLLPADLATPETAAITDEFLAADIVVIGVGFYNFSIGTQLKAWIDRLAIAGRTFVYEDGRPHGLAGDKRLVLAIARGGVYSSGSPAAGYEHAETYLKAFFGFLGITRIDTLIAEGVKQSEEARTQAIEAAVAAAQALPA